MHAPEPPTPPMLSKAQALDQWMAADPWRPRVIPFFVWILAMFFGGFLTDLEPHLQPFWYTLQCVATVWLLWRVRKLVPEMNLRFHWTVVPSAVLLVVAWVWLGAVIGDLDVRPFGHGSSTGTHPIQKLGDTHPAWMWASMVLRLIGMALIVPVFEEVFIRSAMLRGLHRWRPTKTGLIQFACDLPSLGDWAANTAAGKKALAQPPAFTKQLVETPLYKITVFSVCASTAVFAISHVPRDWAGCVACGVVWCLMVWWTNRPSLPEAKRAGLGPVIWSHGLVNALLWGYTLYQGDWRFL
ncbi:MAG: hypothetical protein AAF288_11210 [Planctomycetota bacterium]